jgi:hypothetical protein
MSLFIARPRIAAGAAMLLMAGSVVLSPGSVAAANPNQDMSGFSVQLGTPVRDTPQEQAILAQKDALAKQELQHPGTVYRMNHPAGLSATYVMAGGARVSPNVMTAMTVGDPDGAILGTWVRQQTKAYYCGPTAVQVVADYSWSTGPNAVKYTQQYISNTWTKTDQLLQTPLANEVTGLRGAAKLPAGFTYASARHTNDAAGGAAWHAKLRADIGGYYMPQVASVSPKQIGAVYQLPSWQGSGTAPAGNYGHYIVYYGYITKWDGSSSSPYLFYDDGAGGYGGGTGSWQATDVSIYYMMWLGNPNHAAGYFIW